MPTLFTDPRSGGIKKSSGVNVLPIVAETWAHVRDDSNASVDWLIASFDSSSKTDITVIASGSGGLEACASILPENNACYGGVKLKSGRFVTFYYAPEGCPVMQRGRGVLEKIKHTMICLTCFPYVTYKVGGYFPCPIILQQRRCTKMVRINPQPITFIYHTHTKFHKFHLRHDIHTTKGVLNVLEGSDREIEIRPGLTEAEL